ncbi:hypothetical protein UA08_09340 [Talaromyces atroroseus]|uniref:Uncharacterized protein n=1 Tax=Talaromyces atroroseus TaxID=1441469 RepID=A0A1Q5Q6J7_TALAT|nr:hypothetical protein UA08_09340 [Talaromyces atroroseus]OKL55393.1 hypothetical protein UA08_09340 [Talaromyces atroroseus]
MYGLHAPTITRSEFDGSDTQLALALKLAAARKSGSTTPTSGSTTSSTRTSLDEQDNKKRNMQQSTATPGQKKRLSMFKAAATVFSLK